MVDVTARRDEPPESRDPDALPEFTTVGDYRLVQQLGEGGMGVVHLALDRSGRAVAIKVLRPHVAADPAARTRLAREVETLSRIRNPNVAGIIDHDVEGPLPFIVTRYIAGPSLDAVIDEDGPLRGPALLQLARGLAGALHAIHAAGVVHRDVKPGNVLLLDGEPVLIDFGIAHIADDERLTRTGLVMGTPGYLSPEIIEGGDVDESTDWWGWAATLGFAASGRPPFGRGAMETVLARVVRGDADLRGVDPKLVPLLEAALSPYPEDRPTDAEVIAALERYAEGGPVTDVLRAVPARPQAPLTTPLAMPPTEVLPPVSPPRRVPARQAPPPRQSAPRGRSSVPTPRPPAPEAPYAAPLDPDAGAPPSGGGVRPLPPRPPMAGDPRIGRAGRSGTLTCLGVLIVAIGAAYPALALVLAAGWSIAARTAERSVTASVLRRHNRGDRSGDLARAIAAGPVHLVTGVIAAVAAAIVPAVVGLAGVFAALAVTRMLLPDLASSRHYLIALAAGMTLLVLTSWWGPGGASLRRGSRSLARGMAPSPPAAQFATGLLLLLAAGLAAWAVLRGGMPIWTPRPGPPGILESL